MGSHVDPAEAETLGFTTKKKPQLKWADLYDPLGLFIIASCMPRLREVPKNIPKIMFMTLVVRFLGAPNIFFHFGTPKKTKGFKD